MGSEILNLSIFEQRFRNLFKEAPFSAALLSGDNFVVEMANEGTLELWGKDSSIIGKPLLEGMPEMRDQPVFMVLNQVYASGKTFEGKEQTAYLQKNGVLEKVYVNFVFKAVRHDNEKITGVLAVGYDVTDQVKAKQLLEESDTRARLLIEAVGFGTFERDYETNITQTSSRFDKIFGFTAPAKHEDYIERIHPDDRKTREQAHARGFETGKVSYEARLLLPDKSMRWIKVEGIVIFNDNAKPSKLIGTALDITEEKTSRKKIEKNEARLQALANSMPQVVWTAEHDGTVTYYNDRVSQFAGVTKHGDSWQWHSTLHPDDIEGTQYAWENAVKHKTIYEKEHRVQMKDGTFRWHLSRGYPYETDEGTKWYGTATDVHDQKVLEMNLEKIVKERTLQLERSNDDLQQFAHVASHDLKEPVRKIKTFSLILQDEFKNTLGERGSNLINRIVHATDRMYSMINGVLNYASLPSFTNAFEDVDLRRIIDSIKRDLELLIQEKQATVVQKDLPDVRGIPELIYQLFYNLLNNSLKFTRPGIPAEIVIRSVRVTRHDKTFFEITVSDNGIGFDEINAEEIFVTFVRLHSKDQFEGSGLGLALCKKIVDRHGGYIFAKGEKEKGAQFTIQLPA